MAPWPSLGSGRCSIVRQRVGRATAIFLFVGVWFIILASPLVIGATERGQEPECQEHCLAAHVKVMQKLSEELAKTGNTLAYHEQVDYEISRYSACVTNWCCLERNGAMS